MKRIFACMTQSLVGAVFALSTTAYAAQPISADSMGLSKTSVFAVPEQKAAQYPTTAPGESKLLPRAYAGAPPQVPHDVSDFLPITADSNMCLACHNQPALQGKKREKGAVVPIPASHYTDHRTPGAKAGENVINARFNCNQCHVPQSNAPVLVENTFPHGHQKK